MREVCERRHRLDTDGGKLISCCVEIELSFKMVHSGLKKRFAMQLAPEANCAEVIPRRQRLVSEIVRNLFRRKVDICEDDDPRLRLFNDLRAPACFAAGV